MHEVTTQRPAHPALIEELGPATLEMIARRRIS